MLNTIDKLLLELDQKCQLEDMIIDAPIGQQLADFFNTHASLFMRIRKLHVSVESNEIRLQITRCDLRMGRLETLFWREIITKDQPHLERPIFSLQAPNLQSVAVKLADSDSDNGNVWHSSLLEIDQCYRLRKLRVHLHWIMWESFFEQNLHTMENLTIFHKFDNLPVRSWDDIFSRMPNLKMIRISLANDAIMTAINRHCSKLETLLLDQVELTSSFWSTDRAFPNLVHLRIDAGQIRSDKALLLPVLHHLEWFNVQNQDNHCLKIFAPVLSMLRQARYVPSDFMLLTTPPLCKLQLDLYASNIPDHFFRPYPTMQELSFRVSSCRPDLDRVLGNFKHITKFILIAYNAQLQCDAMLNEMFKHCESITSLTLCGFNPNLQLSFPVFAQIFRNRNLRFLKLYGLNIAGKSSPLQPPPLLAKFEMRYIKVMDVALGAYVFSPDGPFRVVCKRTDEFCCYFTKDFA
ncbi:uncharacterized protein LOC129776245 isoform X2 [Toxorhynchites rutilus septentrionalis]|nr:uncharacterized protein LOC129776245 isoform X2 [Toxorhynchites rutilus septentrionalis]